MSAVSSEKWYIEIPFPASPNEPVYTQYTDEKGESRVTLILATPMEEERWEGISKKMREEISQGFLAVKEPKDFPYTWVPSEHFIEVICECTERSFSLERYRRFALLIGSCRDRYIPFPNLVKINSQYFEEFCNASSK